MRWPWKRKKVVEPEPAPSITEEMACIVCPPTAEMRGPMTGSVTMQCEECGCDVWASESTTREVRELHPSLTPHYICHNCLISASFNFTGTAADNHGEEARMTPQCEAQLLAHGIDTDAVNEALAGRGELDEHIFMSDLVYKCRAFCTVCDFDQYGVLAPVEGLDGPLPPPDQAAVDELQKVMQDLHDWNGECRMEVTVNLDTEPSKEESL